MIFQKLNIVSGMLMLFVTCFTNPVFGDDNPCRDSLKKYRGISAKELVQNANRIVFVKVASYTKDNTNPLFSGYYKFNVNVELIGRKRIT